MPAHLSDSRDSKCPRLFHGKSTLAQRNGQSGVFALVDGRAKWTPVQAGGEVQGQIEIIKGLVGGETLIVIPPGAPIHDGERVRVEGESA